MVSPTRSAPRRKGDTSPVRRYGPFESAGLPDVVYVLLVVAVLSAFCGWVGYLVWVNG